MSFYSEHCLPHFLHLICNMKAIQKQRARVIPQASGRILEIGMGSGLNLPYYDPAKVEFIWGLEPSKGMRKKAQQAIISSPVEVRWLDLPSEAIPLKDDSVDTIVLTYTLCTIEGWQQALGEMRRVLKPSGTLLFCEHGRAPDKHVCWQQNLVNPLWKPVAGGCNLNRPIPELLAAGGFTIQSLESAYIPGPKMASYTYWGWAQ